MVICCAAVLFCLQLLFYNYLHKYASAPRQTWKFQCVCVVELDACY